MRRGGFVAVAVAILGSAPGVLAASEARNARPELAGIKSVQVVVSADEIRGLNQAELRSKVVGRLATGGLRIEDSREKDTIFIRIATQSAPVCPNAAALSVTISLSENVKLNRAAELGKVAVIIWQETEVAFVSPAGAAQEATARTIALIDTLTASVAYATRVYNSDPAK